MGLAWIGLELGISVSLAADPGNRSEWKNFGASIGPCRVAYWALGMIDPGASGVSFTADMKTRKINISTNKK